MNFLDAFQFDNLIRGRVPFCLVNIDVDLKAKYTSIENSHIEKISLSLVDVLDLNKPNKWPKLILKKLQAEKVSDESAIVVLCSKEDLAKETAEFLVKKFPNSYWFSFSASDN